MQPVNLLLIVVALCLHSQTLPAADATKLQNKDVLVSEVKRLTDQVASLDKDIETIKAIAERVKQLAGNKTNSDARIEECNKRIADLQKILAGLSTNSTNSTNNSTLESHKSLLDRFKRAIDDLPNPSSIQDAIYVIGRDASVSMQLFRYELIDFLNSQYTDQFVPDVDPVPEAIDAPYLEAWIDFGEKSVEQAKKVAALQDKVTEKLNAKQDSLEKQRVELVNTLNEKQANLDSLEGQIGDTYKHITYMMWVLLACFALTVLLRFLAKDNAVIISDRTLIEFGGMSFLLLTVIILASGGRIEGETVGPLLGTIAGYIFGKSMSSAGENHDGNGKGEGNGQQQAGK